MLTKLHWKKRKKKDRQYSMPELSLAFCSALVDYDELSSLYPDFTMLRQAN
jgi:hypothetical protein